MVKRGWVPLRRPGQPEPDLSDMPRYLTTDEIAVIASNIPQAFTKDQYSALVIRGGLMKALEWSLSRVELSPSMIPKFINILIGFYKSSLISPGSAVGMAATEAIAAILTQATLNTFHYSGSSQTIGGSVAGARDVIQATATPKNPVCIVHFANKNRSFEEVLNERQRISGTTIADCIYKDPHRNYRIGRVIDIPKLWWEDSARALLQPSFRGYQPQMKLRLFFNPVELYKQKITLAMIAKILQSEHPPSVVILYGPTSEGVMDIYPTADIDKDIDSILGMSVQPQQIAVFEQLFLSAIVYPELEKLKIKGITGMGELIPVKMPVWSMVLYEVPLTYEVLQTDARDTRYADLIDRGGWLLYLNKSNIRKTGVTPKQVAQLCALADMVVHKVDEQYIIIELTGPSHQLEDGTVVVEHDQMFYELANITDVAGIDMVELGAAKRLATGLVQWEYHGKKIISEPNQLTLMNGSYYRNVNDLIRHINGERYIPVLEGVKITPFTPSKFLTWKLSLDKEIYDRDIQDRNAEIRVAAAALTDEDQKRYMLRMPVNLPLSPLKKRSEYVYAIVKGENLGPILGLSGIDRRRSTCTNMHVLRKLFGIENTYTYIVRAIHNVIASSGNYIHPTHIKLIAELMCSRGTPLGLSFTAVGRLNFGHMTGSTIAKAGQVFSRSAIHAREETVANTSAAISMGTLINIGTGYTDVVQKVTIDGKSESLINDEITVRFKDSLEEQERNGRATIAAATGLDDNILDDLRDVMSQLDLAERETTTEENGPVDENLGVRTGQIPVGQVQPPMVVGPSGAPEPVELVLPIPGLPDISGLTIDRILTAQNIQRQMELASLDPTGLFDLESEDQLSQ